MRPRSPLTLFFLAGLALTPIAGAADANRLAYLDEPDPYHVGLGFPRLTTPQWVGEPGVEAVVVLAIDDMNTNTARYEAYLRPILERLKRIDGRAGVSIMTNRVDPADPQLQAWIAEGLNIDVHSLTHPCPLLQKGDFAAARDTYHNCVDLLARVPNNRPVAFRVPCCDSLNTPSPRFFAELFNGKSPEGRFLSIDTSVFCVLTPDDPALPREITLDPDGRERFRKYIPFPSFVNTIENYPYPYVIGGKCWEFPCIVPSDWEGQNLNKPNSPKTLADLKAALDAVVLKQGTFNLVFHPHGWIENSQVVELIDHAVARHGPKVKFLNFREAQDRLDQHLLGGQTLRAADGGDNGVRLLDLDADGFLDVVVGNEDRRETRLWDPKAGAWKVGPFPTPLVQPAADGSRREAGVRFGVVRPGLASMLVRNEAGEGAWTFRDGAWAEDRPLIEALGDEQGRPVATARDGLDRGVRLRDVDGDGRTEAIVANPDGSTLLTWTVDPDARVEPDPRKPRGVGERDAAAARARLAAGTWSVVGGVTLPQGARFAEREGRDGGLRLVDVDEDGGLDLVFAHDEGFGLFLWESSDKGWAREVAAGKAGAPDALPLIVRGGTNNGFWAHSRQLWWQNEDTASLPNLVDRRSYNDLLQGVEPRARSAEASRRSIRVRPGFRVELAAAEPLVADPIAFDWSADGRLWVVEMGDYPLGEDGKGKPAGRVRVLEDRDTDGRYERSTVFLDGLGFPTGLLPWRDGVLIACAPDVLYAEDRDGDGKADVRRTLFSGFREGNQQHRVNGFALGLDGWVYGANGDSGGTITSAATGAKVSIQGRDFRFDPDTGAFEAESGMTQFGRHRDDFGRWFGTNNPSWGWHYVLADRDLRRNPLAALASPRQVLDPDTRLYPVSRTVARFNDPHAANRVTSATSPEPYRDDLFGPAFATSLFVGDPVHNLVRRVVLEPNGPTFRGRRAPDEADREFLASSDHWFRPTTIKTGPDGALWVADMYRAVIEHPEWIPDDWEKRLDLRAGHDRGRIFRVVPVDTPTRPIPRLDKLDAAGLAAAIDGPNGWVRDTAMRLLMHDPKARAAAIGPLRKVASSADPRVRVQAIATLELLGGLTADLLAEALTDPHPQVRRHAARRAVPRVAENPELADRLLALADDADPEVQLELAAALGDWPDPRAAHALARLALRDRDDPWQRAAVLSSATPHAAGLLAELFAGSGPDGPPSALVEPLFARLGSSPQTGGLTDLIRKVGRPADGDRFAAWQFGAQAGLLDAADRARKPLDRWNEVDPAWPEAVAGLARMRAAARDRIADDSAQPEDRVQAATVLGRVEAEHDADLDALAGVLRPQVGPEVQQAAIRALARTRDRRVPDKLVAGWRGHGPAVRAAVLETLLARDGWTASLLSSLEDTCVPPAEIGPSARRRLLDQADSDLKARALAVFGEDAGGNRQAVIDAYRAAATDTGDEAAGAVVFRRACATCHRLNDTGHEVGPDLAALTDKAPMSLLVAILDPNRTFESPHAEFLVHAADGRVVQGLVAAETSTGVTLLGPEGRRETLLRADIEAMAATGKSLMPEGLEKDIPVREMADLIAFLRAVGPPPKTLEGNRPRIVEQGQGGELILKAESASAFGATLVFETRYGNLGYWTSADDRASWRFQVARPDRYEVWIDFACPDGSEGQTLLFDFGSATIAHRTTATGSWDDYRRVKIGEIVLESGTRRLDVRPAAPPKGAVIDLRAVELRPRASDACCGPIP